ncbi:dna repair protein nse1 [Nannochloropsis oceanica]
MALNGTSSLEARQAFLQLLMSRKVMNQKEVEDAFAMLSETLNLRGYMAQSEIKSCLSELNKDLHECNLQIKGMLLNGTEVYAIVNILSDEVAKLHASKMKDWEKAYFKEVIRTICENGGDPVDKDELTALRVQVGGTAPYTREKEAVLYLLEAEFWLQKDKHARLSLGPRTFLELSDFVRAHEMEMPQILYF